MRPLVLLTLLSSLLLVEPKLTYTGSDQDAINERLVPCIFDLINKYFKSERALKGSLVVVNLSPTPGFLEQEILRSLNENPNHEAGVMVKDARKPHLNASHVTERAKNYFIILSEAAELSATVRQLHSLPTWNPLAQVVVLFTTCFDEERLAAEVYAVLEELRVATVLDVNVLSQREDSAVVQAYTYFPYEGDNCATRVQNVRLIDECEFGEGNFSLRRSHFDSLFPKIPRKLHGCPLNVSAVLLAPFVVADEDSIKRIERGLEVTMVRMIADEMRMTPVFHAVEEEVARRLITGDNETGLYADILRGRSDVMIGGLYENGITRQLLSPSIPYYQDDLTWCVATPDLASNWSNVIAIFNLHTWLMTILALQITGLLIYYYAKLEPDLHENITWATVVSLAFTLSTTAPFNPRRNTVKLFLTILMFYGLHLNVAYHSFLITVLTRPRYEPQVDSIEMALDKKFQLFGDENLLYHYQHKDDDRAAAKIASKLSNCSHWDACLARIATDHHVAVATSRLHASNTLAIQPQSTFCFSRSANIYTYSVSMMCRRNHHLLGRLNGYIRTISESGLLTKWLQDSAISHADQDASPSPSTSKGGGHGGSGGPVIKLRMRHVQGGFLVGAIGLAAACVAFAAEWIVYWVGRRGSGGARWRRAESLFC